MLLNLSNRAWTQGLILKDFNLHKKTNREALEQMQILSEAYNKSIVEESELTPEQLKTRHVGKQDPKRHLEENVEKLMTSNIFQGLGTVLSTVLF